MKYCYYCQLINILQESLSSYSFSGQFQYFIFWFCPLSLPAVSLTTFALCQLLRSQDKTRWRAFNWSLNCIPRTERKFKKIILRKTWFAKRQEICNGLLVCILTGFLFRFEMNKWGIEGRVGVGKCQIEVTGCFPGITNYYFWGELFIKI